MSGQVQETRLVRAFPGPTIHLRGCKRARRVVPWVWAEGRRDEEWVVYGWLKPCRVCLPELAALQDELRARAAAPGGNPGEKGEDE